MLEHIYVIIGSGSSDIGKGWLTGSIASVLPKAFPVKIDPMLNRQIPIEVGVTIENEFISRDFATYQELGLPIFPECNIVGGALLLEFLQQPTKTLNVGQIKKLTFADVSDFLANKLLSLIDCLENCQNLVIEVGGIITDTENIYIPGAIRKLGFKTGVTPEMIILSYLEHPETTTGAPVRTHTVRHAVHETRRKYALPIKCCFVRRRYVPAKVPDKRIQDEMVNIAFEIQLSTAQVVYLPNLANVHELRAFIEKTGVFTDQNESFLVSACLLGVPCRYDGATDELDQRTVDFLKQQEVITICPELLAGLPIPRGPFEIVGGDGYDVLDGKAKVLSHDGNDYTKQFIEGAQRALEIAKRMKATKAILYHKSPSCGCLQIFDGSFSKQLRSGYGVFAALLVRNGIRCVPNIEL